MALYSRLALLGTKQLLRAARRFYLAIPPSVFAPAARSIKSSGMATTGWTRVIVEKPFGHDLVRAPSRFPAACRPLVARRQQP